MAVSAKGSCET